MAVISNINGVALSDISKIVGVGDETIYALDAGEYPTINPTGMEGWWRMDEGTGTALIDAMGKADNGLIANGSWETGEVRDAVGFNGSSTLVTIDDPGTDSHLDFGPNEEISIACWAYLDSGGSSGTFLVKNRESLGTANYQVGAFDAGPAFILWYGTGWTYIDQSDSGEYPTADTWHHFVFTWTYGVAASYKIYIDGLSVALGWVFGDGTANNPSEGNEALQMGAVVGTQFRLTGDLDDMRLYRRTLLQDEITKLASM